MTCINFINHKGFLAWWLKVTQRQINICVSSFIFLLNYLHKYLSEAINSFTGIFGTHVLFSSIIFWLHVALVLQHVTEVTQLWLFVHTVKDYITVFLQWAAAPSSCQKMWGLREDLLQPEGSVQFTSTASGSKIYCFNWSAFPNPHLAVARESQGGSTWRGWHICSPSGCRDIHPISQQVWPSLLVFGNVNAVSRKCTKCWGIMSTCQFGRMFLLCDYWIHFVNILCCVDINCVQQINFTWYEFSVWARTAQSV